MKISELSTERAADVLCEITPFIANIVSDTDLLATLKEKVGSGASIAELYVMGAKKYATIVPIVLKTHRDDVFGLLSALNETDVETVAKQNIIETMMQVREVAKDKALLDFFKSWQQEDETA